MKEKTEVVTEKVLDMDQNVLRAVYALNMCTVSVSQIIDYNDVYILEQEYDAILNNLNLEKMPKADALKNILVELLNTITFFRIKEIRKEQIEKNYQKRVKNAIWSAIPNLNVIVAGNPAAMAVSIATQVGIGYMNYRKEKNNALSDKEKEELELRVTAIEQFNALRRELFTTAWELAEEYEFEDRLRLTEKQIKQYNQILMDQDELRKYVRLEAIKDNFDAFPPFWYFFGHTACYIAEDKTLPLEEWEREHYRSKAKEHFQHYEDLNKFNILREDQMTCAFALEYVDLLLLEESDDEETKFKTKNKIEELIAIADAMSGNALDIKELCAIAYLKIGKTQQAAKILMQLVNEDYNAITNAKILSRIYVSQYLNNKSATAKFDYKTLVMRMGEDRTDYLFPMPENNIEDKQLQLEYLIDQKILLQMDYRAAINELMHKYSVLFNAVVPAPYGYTSYEEYYGTTDKAVRKRLEDVKSVLENQNKRALFLEKMANVGFRFKFIDLLNEAMEACDELSIWKEAEYHDLEIKAVRANLVQKNPILKEIQDKMNSREFSENEYNKLQIDLSFKAIAGRMFDEMKNTIVDAIDKMDSLEKIENAEYNLVEFCQKHDISLVDTYGSNHKTMQEVCNYLDYSILGADGEEEQIRQQKLVKMHSLVKHAASELLLETAKKARVLLPGSVKFDTYFMNTKLSNGAALREQTLFIIDTSKTDYDIIVTEKEVRLVKGNRDKEPQSYRNITYSISAKNEGILVLGDSWEYMNKEVNIEKLYDLIKKLEDVDNENLQ